MEKSTLTFLSRYMQQIQDAEFTSTFNLSRRILKNGKQSAVSNYLLECDCLVEFGHFDIVAYYLEKFRLVFFYFIKPFTIKQIQYQ